TLHREVLERAEHAWAVARELSRIRQAVAIKLEKRMAEDLRVLGMRRGIFRVAFTVSGSDVSPSNCAGGHPGTSGLNPAGADVIEFHLSANPGEDPKPLARIASGGELSRIM